MGDWKSSKQSRAWNSEPTSRAHGSHEKAATESLIKGKSGVGGMRRAQAANTTATKKAKR